MYSFFPYDRLFSCAVAPSAALIATKIAIESHIINLTCRDFECGVIMLSAIGDIRVVGVIQNKEAAN
jgi:hypothetical protein